MRPDSNRERPGMAGDNEPIELRCIDCGRVMGVFDWNRLDRSLRATLRIMGDLFAKKAHDTTEEGAPFPIVCAQCVAVAAK